MIDIAIVFGSTHARDVWAKNNLISKKTVEAVQRDFIKFQEGSRIYLLIPGQSVIGLRFNIIVQDTSFMRAELSETELIWLGRLAFQVKP